MRDIYPKWFQKLGQYGKFTCSLNTRKDRNAYRQLEKRNLKDVTQFKFFSTDVDLPFSSKWGRIANQKAILNMYRDKGYARIPFHFCLHSDGYLYQTCALDEGIDKESITILFVTDINADKRRKINEKEIKAITVLRDLFRGDNLKLCFSKRFGEKQIHKIVNKRVEYLDKWHGRIGKDQIFENLWEKHIPTMNYISAKDLKNFLKDLYLNTK